jgi:hypothetical protein
MAVQNARDWKFLATGETLTVEGKQVRGLNLPQPVLAENTSQQCHPLDSGIVTTGPALIFL